MNTVIDPNKMVKIKSAYTKNIKPFTNKDPFNVFEGAKRRPRPIKHVRKGHSSTYDPWQQSVSDNGMPGLLTSIQDFPGSYVPEQIECKDGGSMYTSITKQNETCCPGGNTYHPNNQYNNMDRYKNTTLQYLQGRCLTYDQNVYNFVAPKSIPENTYIVKCDQPVPSVACSKTAVYKPSNPQYAIQGATTSSTRTFRLSSQTVDRSLPYTNVYPKYFVSPPKKSACNPLYV
jgi:hypothetical protein